jgi:DNA-binding response OmpR family regulator
MRDRKMTAASPIDDCASELRILYLEDESLIAMNYVAMLEAAGAVVDDCTTLGAAFTALDEGTYDVALLDVNIRETMSFPLAAAALAKGLPVVFVTGYGKDVLPPEWSGHVVCEKPCSQAGLLSAIQQALLKKDAPTSVDPHLH